MIRHYSSRTLAAGLILLLVAAATPEMGGFHMRADYSLDNGVALVVRATGCHKPAKAAVVGTAEGIVNGVRRSDTLTLTSKGAGIYDVVWARPDAGDWVLTITGTYNGNVSSLIIDVDGNGQVRLPEPDKYGMRFEPLRRALTASDVDSALRRLAISR